MFANRSNIGDAVDGNEREPETPRRRPGRPRLCESPSSITTLIEPADHDRLIELAKRHDMSVSAVIRTILTRTLHGKLIR